MVYIIKCFLEIYEGDVSVLTESFTDVADVIEGVNMVSAGTVWSEAILLIADFVVLFKIHG